MTLLEFPSVVRAESLSFGRTSGGSTSFVARLLLSVVCFERGSLNENSLRGKIKAVFRSGVDATGDRLGDTCRPKRGGVFQRLRNVWKIKFDKKFDKTTF